MGENIPFYYTSNKKTNEEDDASDRERKIKTKENLFFPSKDGVLPSSPKWSMRIPAKYVRPQDVNFNKKIEDTKNKWEAKRIKFNNDIALSYLKVNDGKKGIFTYHKVIETIDSSFN